MTSAENLCQCAVHYVNNGMTSETFPEAVKVWRAYIKQGKANTEVLNNIRKLCWEYAGYPAECETALLLYDLHSTDELLSPVRDTILSYLRDLYDHNEISDDLVDEVADLLARADKGVTLFSALQGTAVNVDSLSVFLNVAGHFSAFRPSDYEVASKYLDGESSETCTDGETEPLLRTIFNRRTKGSEHLFCNLPLLGHSKLTEAILSHLCRNSLALERHNPSACYRGMCTLARFAVKFGLEIKLLDAQELHTTKSKGNLAAYYADRGLDAFLFFVKRMLLAGHTQAASRWLNTIQPPKATYSNYLDDLRGMSEEALAAYVTQPLNRELLSLILTDNQRVSYQALMERMLLPSIRGEESLSELEDHLDVLHKLMEVDPKDTCHWFVQFYICKQAAALASEEGTPLSNKFLRLLYISEYRLLTQDGKSTIQRRLDRDTQLSDLLVLGHLIARKGIAWEHNDTPLPTHPCFKTQLENDLRTGSLSISTENHLRSAIKKEFPRLDEMEINRRVKARFDDAFAAAADELTTSLNKKLEYWSEQFSKKYPRGLLKSKAAARLERLIIARVTGVWQNAAQDAAQQKKWLQDNLPWLCEQADGQYCSFQCLGFVRGVLQHYITLDDAGQADLCNWFMAQLDTVPTPPAEILTDEDAAVKNQLDSIRRPFVQLHFLLLNEPQSTQTLPMRFCVSENKDLFQFPLEEASYPAKLLHNELSNFTPDNSDGYGDGVSWRGRDFKRFSQRVTLAVICQNTFRTAKQIAYHSFCDDTKPQNSRHNPRNNKPQNSRHNPRNNKQQNSRHSPPNNKQQSTWRNLQSAYSYYLPMRLCRSNHKVREDILLRVVPDDSVSKSFRYYEYACHLVGGVGEPSSTVSENTELGALLTLLRNGRPEDFPVFLARLSHRTFVEKIYDRLRTGDFTEQNEALAFAEEFASVPLQKVLVLILLSRLYPALHLDEICAETKALLPEDEKRSSYLHVWSGTAKKLAERRSKGELPQLGGFDFDKAFISDAQKLLNNLKDNDSACAPLTGSEHPLTKLWEQAVRLPAEDPKRLQALHYLAENYPEWGEDLIPSKDFLCFELGVSVFHRQQKFGVDWKAQKSKAQDTLFRLMDLCSYSCDPALSAANLSGRFLPLLCDFCAMQKQLDPLLSIFAKHRISFSNLQKWLDNTEHYSQMGYFIGLMERLINEAPDFKSDTISKLDRARGTPFGVWPHIFTQVYELLTQAAPELPGSSGTQDGGTDSLSDLLINNLRKNITGGKS